MQLQVVVVEYFTTVTSVLLYPSQWDTNEINFKNIIMKYSGILLDCDIKESRIKRSMAAAPAVRGSWL